MTTETVFLTGATGTVGSGILEVLLSAGYEVHCLVRQAAATPAITQAGGHAIVGDMTDREVFRRLSSGRSFTFIIHAAQAHYRNHSNEEIHRQEKTAVENLGILCGASTKLMIFTCGVWIYGNCAPGTVIDESTPLAPRHEAVNRCVLMATLAAQRDSLWAQFCLPNFVYGSTGPLIELAQRLSKGDVEMSDDDSAQWSVIERLDLGRAYLALLRHGKPGDYFVIAEDAPVMAVVLHEAIAGHIHHGRVIRKACAKQSGIVTNQPVNSTRFKQLTGWNARESCLTSIPKFIRPRCA